MWQTESKGKWYENDYQITYIIIEFNFPLKNINQLKRFKKRRVFDAKRCITKRYVDS